MATPKAWRTPSLSFGLVNINVGVGTLERNGKVEGHKYCPDHKTARVKQQWVCTEDGEVVAEPVSGYDHPKGMVTLTNDEKSSCKSGKTGLQVEGFTDLGDIDPSYYESTYNIWAAADDASIKSFNAVAVALRNRGKVAVGKVCFTDSTKMFVLRWSERIGTLVLEVCTYDANFRWDEIKLTQEHHAAGPQPSDAEVALAEQIIDLQMLDKPFVEFAQSITDDYQVALRAAIDTKAEGGAVTAVVAAKKGKSTTDLMAQLQASVDAAAQAKKSARKPKAKAAA